MFTTTVDVDLAVVGGGLAGVCAAIAAARQGTSVALLQNRSVLGGNSSSEIRVWVCGATAHGAHQWARETGIMGELFIENQYRNREGNPYYWDLVLLDAVRAEPNLQLFLNTDVRQVHTDGDTITGLTGWQMGSETVVEVTAKAFVDASGDGLVGALAGAEFATGREARAVFDESWAPEVADTKTLGSTLLFYTKDAGAPSRFVAPDWALDVSTIPAARRRMIRSSMKGCDYWWIEWGGDQDVVRDNEQIRDRLQAAVYGIWDHIKNSGEFDGVANLTLEWIGSQPGKREYRRFTGDHVLTQHDILNRVEFEDRVAFGGWSIDLHPPGGLFAPEEPSRHWYSKGNYHIPLRSLYSRNVSNLWVAGRDISASHVAFGSTRVMATCAVLGEAAGLGAAVSLQHGLTPRQLATEQFALMAHQLVRSDASVLGLANTDPSDLARQASVSASSTLTRLEARPAGSVRSVGGHSSTEPNFIPAEGEPKDAAVGPDRATPSVPIGAGAGLLLPASGGLGAVEWLLQAEQDTEVTLRVLALDRPQDTQPGDTVLAERTMPVRPGRQWVRFDLPELDLTEGNAFVALFGEASVVLAEHRVPGVLAFTRRLLSEQEAWTEQFREWKVVASLLPFCFRLPHPTTAFAPERAIGGYARPYGGPQMWSSADEDHQPWLRLDWASPVEVDELQVVLDDDVALDLINLHHHITEDEVMPTLVRDYDLEVGLGGSWRTIAQVRGNRHRHQRHGLGSTQTIDALRLTVLTTNGAPRAQVVKLRAYSDAPPPVN